jgi:CPA2 family monovalent cation:H+ antiporter-2
MHTSPPSQPAALRADASANTPVNASVNPGAPVTGPAAQPSDPPAAPVVAPVAPPVDVVIVGFGLPGRFVAEVLDARDVPYAIVELNPSNARSIASCGKRVVCGDARSVEVMKAAGIEHAKILALTLPDEKAVIEALHVARRLNPNIKMLARCNYTSTGMKAEKAGASVVLVEEQLVALEFAKLMSNTL